MGKRRVKSFYYIIIDEDQKLFTHIGPISSDDAWNHKVVKAQKEGRNIRACSSWTSEELAKSITFYTQRGFKFTDRLLIEYPTNRKFEYSGTLPNYARSADRNRIVKFLCKNCGFARFGEMYETYPGDDVLRTRT